MAAGLGFKTFVTGDVLTAADTNGYLMQGVLVFASAAARDSAITSPQEGQFAYTKDTNGLWYYDGAAWVASGAAGDIEGVTAGTGISGGGTSGTVTITNSMATAIDAKGDLVVGTGADTFSRLAVGTNAYVLTADSAEATGIKWATPAAAGTIVKQITFGTLKATASTSSTTFTDTGLSASITPTSASSKIMVTANVSLAPMASGGIFLTLTDGSNTILLDPTSSGSRSKVFSRIEGDTAGQYTMFAQTLQFVDSPGSTSAKTYKIRWFVSGGTGYINRMTTDSDSDGYAAGISTITLTEYAV
jgi:hypothetical protein